MNNWLYLKLHNKHSKCIDVSVMLFRKPTLQNQLDYIVKCHDIGAITVDDWMT